MTTENRQDAPLPASDKQEGMEQNAPISFDEMVNLRAKALQERRQPPPERERPPEEPEQEQEASEEEPPEAEDESIAEDGETEQDVLSKFDLENMSEDELAKLGEAIRSKVPKRFGELTKRAKTAEERIAELEAKLVQKEQAQKNPLERPKAQVENNPFKDIESIEGLQEQWDNFQSIEEWADNLLDENDTAAADEVIAEHEGRDLTKREVKQYLKKARQAREKFLPARLAEIQQIEQAKQVKVALEEKAKGEFEWYGDGDSDLRREYETLLNDPRVKLVEQRVPELGPQFAYILAHAVDSMASKMAKTAAPAKKAPTKLTPPSQPDGGVARSNSRDTVQKELKEMQERFAQSQSYDDLIALRTKQRLRKT